jgi:hypothetical protein
MSQKCSCVAPGTSFSAGDSVLEYRQASTMAAVLVVSFVVVSAFLLVCGVSVGDIGKVVGGATIGGVVAAGHVHLLAVSVIRRKG